MLHGVIWLGFLLVVYFTESKCDSFIVAVINYW